jgi:hypothetical protein
LLPSGVVTCGHEVIQVARTQPARLDELVDLVRVRRRMTRPTLYAGTFPSLTKRYSVRAVTPRRAAASSVLSQAPVSRALGASAMPATYVVGENFSCAAPVVTSQDKEQEQVNLAKSGRI